jgi:hypothetical protein
MPMKSRAHACCLAAVLPFVCSLAAQTPLDFSGKWTVVPSKGATGAAMGSAPPTLSAQGDMGSGWGSEITITQDASVLTVVYTYFHPREIQPPFTFKYLLNGAESRNTVNMGRGPQERSPRRCGKAARSSSRRRTASSIRRTVAR